MSILSCLSREHAFQTFKSLIDYFSVCLFVFFFHVCCIQVTKNGSGSHERMFFLFSDILIYAKHNMSLERPLLAKPYTCSSVIQLDDCKVDLVLGEKKIDGAGALFKVIP